MIDPLRDDSGKIVNWAEMSDEEFAAAEAQMQAESAAELEAKIKRAEAREKRGMTPEQQADFEAWSSQFDSEAVRSWKRRRPAWDAEQRKKAELAAVNAERVKRNTSKW